ncbi:hypothetical protein BVX98_03540, partial [bacterium F11]
DIISPTPHEKDRGAHTQTEGGVIFTAAIEKTLFPGAFCMRANLGRELLEPRRREYDKLTKGKRAALEGMYTRLSPAYREARDRVDIRKTDTRGGGTDFSIHTTAFSDQIDLVLRDVAALPPDVQEQVLKEAVGMKVLPSKIDEDEDVKRKKKFKDEDLDDINLQKTAARMLQNIMIDELQMGKEGNITLRTNDLDLKHHGREKKRKVIDIQLDDKTKLRESDGDRRLLRVVLKSDDPIAKLCEMHKEPFSEDTVKSRMRIRLSKVKHYELNTLEMSTAFLKKEVHPEDLVRRIMTDYGATPAEAKTFLLNRVFRHEFFEGFLRRTSENEREDQRFQQLAHEELLKYGLGPEVPFDLITNLD